MKIKLVQAMKSHKQISNNGGFFQSLNSSELLALRTSNKNTGFVEKDNFSFLVWRPDVYLDSIPEEFEGDDDTSAIPGDSEFVSTE